MSASTSSTGRRLLLNRRALEHLLNGAAKKEHVQHKLAWVRQQQRRQLASAPVAPATNASNLIDCESSLRAASTCRALVGGASGTGRPSGRPLVAPGHLFALSSRAASSQAQQRVLCQRAQQRASVHEAEPAYEEDDNYCEPNESKPLDGQRAVERRARHFTRDQLMLVQCSPSELKPKLEPEKLVFGHAFTDHMLRVDWDLECGWSRPLISKLHNLDIHPGAKVLHYALEAFEGAKAYRGHDGKIRFFRLDQNVRRLLASARRLALPEFDERELIKCIHRLVQLDQDWIPEALGDNQLSSLYIRPSIMGVEPSLGVASSKKALLYVLLSPVGPYFRTGFKPVSLYADPKVVRAWPGGAGNTKLGANYAPTIAAQLEAERMGLQQVLWLFGDDMKLTEVGTMNIFVAIKSSQQPGKLHLVTPPLSDGLILPGITRDSILQLAGQWSDVIVEQRYLTIEELKQLAQQGSVVEMFGAGTACIVCPISSIHMRDGTQIHIPYSDVTATSSDSEAGAAQLDAPPSITKRILKSITDIQYGRVKHPWATELIYS